MRKFVTVIGLVLVAFACATGGDMVNEMLDSGVPDAGAQPGSGGGMKFVGNSTEKFSLTGGLFAAYTACQQTFGAGHRMCTLAEILNTAEVPTLAAGQSVYQTDLNDLPCGGWAESRTGSSPNFNYLRAPAVDETGKFVQASCGSEYTVACCGPK